MGVDVERDLAPLTAEVDPEQVGRALKNLLANAIDALEPVSERRLRVALRRVTAHGGEQAEIEIQDSGVGFGPEVARRAFEPYFTTRQGGTGLGLAIVSRIAADHGGSVRASGAPGAGARLTLRLPLTARRRTRG
jgi:signal transduction histidine kinase